MAPNRELPGALHRNQAEGMPEPGGAPDTPGGAAEPPVLKIGPWSEPIEVVGVNSNAVDDDPSFTEDLLELYFASDRTGSERIFVAHDGLSLCFVHHLTPVVRDIYVITRPDRDSSFSAPQAVPGLTVRVEAQWRNHSAKPRALRTCKATKSIRTLGSPRTVGNSTLRRRAIRKRDLYWTNRAAPDGEFATPTPIVELNTDSREEEPWLSRDQGLIMFMSERSGYRKPLHVDALTGAGEHATRSSHAPHAEPLQASVHEQLERQRNPARLDGTAGRLPAFCASRLTRDGFVLPRTNVRPQSLALGRNASRHARARPDRQQQTQDWHQGDLSHVE